MANEVALKTDTPQISFADHLTDFTGGGAGMEQGTPTDVQIDLTSLGDGAARQSDKVDLGALRPQWFSVMALFEPAVAPDLGSTIEVWWSPSPDPTAGNANTGNVAGADAAFTGYVGGNIDTALAQGQFIGYFPCTVDNVPQIAFIGKFTPAERYGTLIVYNKCGQALFANADEHIVIFDPIIPEVQ